MESSSNCHSHTNRTEHAGSVYPTDLLFAMLLRCSDRLKLMLDEIAVSPLGLAWDHTKTAADTYLHSGQC